MFRVGRQKTVWLRGTAGLGVVLTLTIGVRPAFGWSLFGRESKPAPATSAPPQPARPPVPPPPAVEMVRGRVAPTSVRVDVGPSGTLIGSNNPWRLFDGDGVVGFMAGTPTRVRATLPAGTVVQGLGAYGASNATLTVFSDEAGTAPMKGLDHVSLAGLPLRWNRFAAASPAAAQALVIEIDPAPGGQADVRELEIWGTTPERAPAAPGSVAEALLTGLPPSAVSVNASPSSGEMSYPKLGPDRSTMFRVDLTEEAIALSRAFLVYNLEGLPHWSAARRRINGLTVSGGVHAHRAAGGLQVEEISPSWLRAGTNEIEFLASNPNDPIGYKVKDLRVVVVPAAGDAPAYALTSGAASNAVRALVDGKGETGISAKEVGEGMAVDLKFPTPSQPDSLLVATDRGDKVGTITIDPVVHGKVQHDRRVTAHLQDLKAGWSRIPLDATPTEADGVRVLIQGDDEHPMKGRIAEMRATGSPRPVGSASSLKVSYPLAGECVDGEAYVVGFLQPDGTGTLAGSKLKVDGAVRSKALGPDGAFSAIVPPPPGALRNGKKWKVDLEADFSNGDVVQRTVDIEGCRAPEVAKAPTGPVEDQGAPFGQVVHAGQATTLSFAGATLEIPAGAVTADTRVTVRPLGDVQVPATDETLTNVTIGGQAYRFGPHGMKFAKPVSLTIPYDRFRFPTGMTEEDLGVFFFDEAVGKYHQVQTVKGSASAHTVTAVSTHFTDFIAATIATPDHPTADSFNPNLIKDVKSADPAAGVDLIAPPTPSPDGAAHLSFPIWVPPGRMGMQPQLAVTYNSNAGNGQMGLGWDLPISSIEVDTRFGVPTYDPNAESETYTLDGEILTVNNDAPVRGQGPTYFRRRAEGKFDTIIRLGASPIEGPNTYSWEVVDKRGIHNFYGETGNSRGSVEGRGVYRWYLSRSEDAFGNQVIYTYNQKTVMFHGSGAGIVSVTGAPPAVEIYPQSITYTADSSGQNPGYRVDIETNGPDILTPNFVDATERPDSFSSARGGTLAFTGHRLANIRVYQAGDAFPNYIRRYNFVYTQGEFGKSLLQKIRVCFGEDTNSPDQGSTPTEFYHHTFAYSTMGEEGTIETPNASFEKPRAWPTTAGNTNLVSNGFSNTTSNTVNGTEAVGAGPIGCDLFHVVVGGSVSSAIPVSLPSYFPTMNDDRTQRGFVDVNGDGLPDLVDAGGDDSPTVLLNGGNVTLNSPLGFPSFVPWTGAQSFAPPGGLAGHSTRSSLSFQTGAHELFESTRATFEEVWSSESTDEVLADIDGDGFVDFLTPGKALMNRPSAGFTDQARWTMPPGQNLVPAKVSQKMADTFVRTDPVMEWVAPMNGHVIVQGPAGKILGNAVAPDDGVMVFFDAYHAGLSGDHSIADWSEKLTGISQCNIIEATQPPSSEDAPQTSGCGAGRSLFVMKGDRFYFRADSIDQIAFDDLLWNPTVTYQDTCPDSTGQNCQSVTADQSNLSESYGTSAFSFSEQSDFRLAGKPVPLWTFESAGMTPRTVRFHNLAPIVKRPTGDDVTLQIMRIPSGGTIASATPIQLPIAMPLGASSSQSVDYDFQYTANPGDRFFFQVSSPTQVDPNMITWNPQVDYVNFCRTDTIPPDQGGPNVTLDPSDLASHLANASTVCGNITDCSPDMSNAQPCHVDADDDPTKKQNPISPTLVFQTLAPYYLVRPWTATGLPVGFVAPSDGQITVTGTYAGSLSNQLLIRSVIPSTLPTLPQERQLDNITPSALNACGFQGKTNCEPGSAKTYSVSAGESITFDVFGDADPPTSGSAAWMVSVSFTGSSGSQTASFQARNNFQPTPSASSDQGGGYFHGWNYFEWNADGTAAFSDQAVQAALSAPPPATDNSSSASAPSLRVMMQAPSGIASSGPGGPEPVGGPIWRGSSFDGYIGTGVLKPSRQGKPTTGGSSGGGAGLSVAFESSQTDASGFGGGFIFGFSPDTSQSSSQIQLIDMNGDRLPDLVTNGGIFYNQANNVGVQCTAGTSPTACENGQFVKVPGASFNMVDPFQSGDGPNLREVQGNQVTATLGISTAVSLYKGPQNPPSWVSMLPTLGLGYGSHETNVELLDVNGDGLPDYVARDRLGGGLSVQINLGYSLTDPISFGQPTWNGGSQPTPANLGGSSSPISNPGDMSSQVAESSSMNVLQFQDNAMNNIGAGYSYFGGNATTGSTRTTVDMIDINGDGLPDMVEREAGSPTMSIWFNTGDGFGIDSGNGPAEVEWSVPAWELPSGEQLGQSLSLGLGDNDALAFANSGGGSFSVGASAYFETGLFGCYGFEFGAGAGISTVGSEMRFEDVDGDGAPDQVLKIDGDENVYVRHNPANNRVNLLVGVTNPLGGFITLTYTHAGNVVDPANGVDMPHQRVVLGIVSQFDAMPGNGIAQTIATDIDYGLTPSPDGPLIVEGEPSGFYSRTEREFFGFGTVTIDKGNGTRITRHYDTSSYEHRNLLKDETVSDVTNPATPTLFRTTRNTYVDRAAATNSSAVFPALMSKETLFYEGLTDDPNAPVKTTTLSYDYTGLGDIKTFTDPDDDDAKNLVTYSIQYNQVIPDPLGTIATLPRPNLIQAFDASGTNLLRQRSAVYGPHGEMQSLSDSLFGGKDPQGNEYTSGGQSLTWSFGYDDFGNLDRSRDLTAYVLNYQYDGTTNSHIVRITDSFGLSSTRAYDMRFGTMSDTTDENGQPEHIKHDDLGRPVGIWAPQDISNGTLAEVPTVAYKYIVADESGKDAPIPAWATTTRKDVAGPNGALETVVFIDGLDRVRQTKKDAAVRGGGSRIVGGNSVFDDKGRIIEEQFPVAEAAGVADTTFDVLPFGRPAKQYAYDVIDRVRSIETSDDKGTVLGFDGQPVAQTLINYDVAPLKNGVQRLRKVTRDPQGKMRMEYFSARGDVVGVEEQNRVGTAFPNGALSTLTTQYTYDPLSELTQVQDASGNVTTATYDSVGHMVKLVSPDAGQTEWRHYGSGLLAAKETANLRSKGQVVTYLYDLNRLTGIIYPPVSGNLSPEDVFYAYGGAGASNNQAGRIAAVTDESGTETPYYDQLGNVSQMMKTMTTQSKSIPSPTYTMKYSYDALGRVLNMTYPDNEVVTYAYDAGGRVSGVSGNRNGTTTQYVTGIEYNELDQRLSISFGNRVTTEYFYYPDTKRLENVGSNSNALSPPLVFQKMTYTYDLVGNVTALDNDIDIPTPVPPNTVIAPGPNFQSFTYDDLYQLTGASAAYEGCACGCGNSRGYTLTMQYDQLGNIVQKTQNDTIFQPNGTSTPQAATTYNNGYSYATTPAPSKAHAPSKIGNETISYDGDGNMATTNGTFGPARTFTWTEDDRLRSEVDSGFTNTYLYDADGNRTHKRRTSIETWYVNPFYVVKGYSSETKHIMVGDSRVASEMASLPSYTNPSTAGAATVFYYHPDHLQSTNFTTGSDGSLLQHDEYIATGEVWFQEAKNSDSRNTQPWLFNAKELDETGLYSFGARYYNPKYSIWSSPDPILASYMAKGASGASPANLGVYTYSWNNPVVIRDPDGRQSLPPSVYDRPGHEGETMRAQERAGRSFLGGLWNALISTIFERAPNVPYAAPGMVDYANPPGAPIAKKLKVPNDVAGDVAGAVVLGMMAGEVGAALAGETVGARAGVPLAKAIEAGLVKPGGKLAQVLGGIERGYAATGPKSALEALGVVQNATSAVGLEPGIATAAKTGEIVLQNVGGVKTTLGANGSVLVQRGADVLLHLVP